MYRKLSIVVLSLFVLSLAVWAQQQDPQMGTWKLNLAKSKYSPGPPPKSPTILKREVAANGGVKTTTDGVDAQGKPTHTESTVKFDGKDYPLTGSPNYDTIAATRIDSNTTIQVEKKGGNVVRMIYRVVAKDGKSYTAVQFGAYGNSPPVHNVVVYEKQ